MGKNNKKRTQEEYITELKIKNPYAIPIDEYVNVHTNIRHLCSIHNKEFISSPVYVLRGKRCSECYKEKMQKNFMKTKDEYEKELQFVNSNIVLTGDYLGAREKTRHKCLICGKEWDTQPRSILQGNGCPICNESKGEKAIKKLLDYLSVDYLTQYRFEDCVDERPLPFDFYLPNNNKAIEYDGEQHFFANEHFGGQEAFEKRQKHDNIKTQYCIDKGIQLLRIPYFNFDKIEEELNNFLFI